MDIVNLNERLQSATINDLFTSLSAKIAIDPIRDYRYRLYRPTLMAAVYDPLAYIQVPEHILFELEGRIPNMTQTEVKDLQDKIIFELNSINVLGSTFIKILMQLVKSTENRLAQFEKQASQIPGLDEIGRRVGEIK